MGCENNAFLFLGGDLENQSAEVTTAQISIATFAEITTVGVRGCCWIERGTTEALFPFAHTKISKSFLGFGAPVKAGLCGQRIRTSEVVLQLLANFVFETTKLFIVITLKFELTGSAEGLLHCVQNVTLLGVHIQSVFGFFVFEEE